MKRILLVCDFYFPNASSIGVCTHKVAKALQLSGNDVHVLAFGDRREGMQGEYDGISYTCIKKRFHERCLAFSERVGGIIGRLLCILGKLKCRIWQLLWFPLFRMDSLSVPLRYLHFIKKLHNQYCYDMIVATYNPFEGMLASYWFKKKHPEVLFCLYVLDSLTHTGKTRFVSEELNEKMGWKWEKRIFPWCDRIINMRCHEAHHMKDKYNPFRSKMVFSDIPFLEENSGFGSYFDDKHIHFVYTGRILKTRSSSYFSSLFEKISANNPYVLHYFSAGDEEKMIKELEDKTQGRIISHGIIPHSQISMIQRSADVLVSIGNLSSEKIPSKIFEYISTGNRIIHLKKEVNDPTIIYYNKYGNVVILDENDSIEQNIIKLEGFLNSTWIRIEYSTISALFPENLPEYTMELILDLLKDVSTG